MLRLWMRPCLRLIFIGKKVQELTRGLASKRAITNNNKENESNEIELKLRSFIFFFFIFFAVDVFSAFRH